MTDHTAYRIERLDQERLTDLAALHRSVYGRWPAKDYFVKKYDTAYTGVQYLGFIAYDRDDTPAAYYGVMPCFIQYNNEMILCAQSGDTMTHSGHRNKGLFVQLASLTFDLCRTKGIRFVFGFPNQNSYHGLVHKLGWEMTGYLEYFHIPINTLPLESLSRRLGLTKWLYHKYSAWVLRKYALPQLGLPNSSITNGFGGVRRDEQYLQYKIYSPTSVIRLGSAKVWFKIKNGLIIGDLDLPEQDLDITMETIEKIAAKLGVSQVLFQLSPGTCLHALLSRKYKAKASFPVVFKDLGANIPLNEIKFTFADVDVF